MKNNLYQIRYRLGRGGIIFCTVAQGTTAAAVRADFSKENPHVEIVTVRGGK